eukprot:6474165-Amphidinium_carterae.1
MTGAVAKEAAQVHSAACPAKICAHHRDSIHELSRCRLSGIIGTGTIQVPFLHQEGTAPWPVGVLSLLPRLVL